jgi:hypothetical protein
VQRKIYVYFAAWLAAVKETKLKDVQNHILPIFALKARAMCMFIYTGKPKVEDVVRFGHDRRKYGLFPKQTPPCSFQGTQYLYTRFSEDNVLSHLVH